MTRRRIDLLLVERGLFESRAKARAAIEAGRVEADGAQVLKPSEAFAEDVALVAEPAHPWVGRAALKLVHALDLWPVPVAGRRVLDLGASTGGFTEVCLARGAATVVAVDVGRGQLHPRLVADPRVVSLEGTDVRALSLDQTGRCDLVVCDMSFISLAKALPSPLALASAGADLICLVKPQFEVGRERVGKGGIVKDAQAQDEAVQGIGVFLEAGGWGVQAQADSPIAGGDGNREILLWATKKPPA